MTTLSAQAEYFEVRLRIKSPSGRLLYQKTEVRHNVKKGSVRVPFQHDLRSLGVSQGRYPLEVRVLATGASATDVTSRILVVAPGSVRVPVTVITRLTSSPAMDPAGRFVLDPEIYTRPRTDAERVCDIIERHPDASISLAIPPFLIEEWLRASDGYEVSGPEGVVKVPEQGSAAIASKHVLERLRALTSSGGASLLDVPYAEPDLPNLAAIDGLDDLTVQWSTTDSILRSTLDAHVTSGTAFLGNAVPRSALEQLKKRKTGYVVLSRASLKSNDATPASGVYTLGASGIRAVVIEPQLAAAASDDDAERFYDILFDRLTSGRKDEPLVMVFDIGPGTSYTTAALERALDFIEDVPWVHMVSGRDAAQYARPSEATLVDRPPAPRAPRGYWSEVARARQFVGALTSALGPHDTDVLAAQSAVLVAESRCWAGPDGRYSLADRGRAFAASATRYAQDVFSTVTIEGQDVTLSNRKGDTPVSIVNGSGKPLKVVVRANARVVSLPVGERTITLDPGENVVTIPVNMGSEISDTLGVRVTAGDVTIAETSFRIRASYLDRLATVGMVVLFLLGLLAFIRRRERQAITSGNEVENEGGATASVPTSDEAES
ncbi:MAG: hypothetical protein ABFC80_03540 [Coriobacteriales bacterium]